MREFIKLPVLFYIDDIEREKLKELLGDDYAPDEFEEGFEFFAVDSIISYNEDSEGLVNLRSGSGDVKVNMEFKEFFNRMQKISKVIDF